MKSVINYHFQSFFQVSLRQMFEESVKHTVMTLRLAILIDEIVDIPLIYLFVNPKGIK